MEQVSQYVRGLEYRAAMESRSGKIHVDIPELREQVLVAFTMIAHACSLIWL
jgi:hypothetical protein